MYKMQQPWLLNPKTEWWLILAPSILPVFLVLFFHNYFSVAEVSTAWWILLILCVDVSHVYSTLFRIYWDKCTYRKYRTMLWVIPLVAFTLGFALHFYGGGIFWRVLAYVAAFHFVRQQYGFMRLYSRMDRTKKVDRWIDAISIYSATAYPLLYWHAHATDKLAWFIKGDFIKLNIQSYFVYFTTAYIVIISIYAAKEIWRSMSNGFNIPKNLVVAGTYASWYVGIVLFQGDLVFTLLNVVAHGIPYMGLVWIYGKRRGAENFAFNTKGVLVFMTILLALAYIEEYFWDGLVWNDHPELFPAFFNRIGAENSLGLSIAIALLVLPQTTHYILDGFIWRFSKEAKSAV